MRAQLRGALPPAEEQEVHLNGGVLHAEEFTPRFRKGFQPPVWESVADLQVSFPYYQVHLLILTPPLVVPGRLPLGVSANRGR